MLLEGEETLLRVLSHLAPRDVAVASAVSVAFRGSLRRLDQSVTVRLQTPEEMMDEEPPESDEDINDIKFYYTELGHVGAAEVEGVHVLKARISLAGYQTHAEMVLLERRKNLRYNFHEACDAESAELELVGTSFCDARGRIRLASVKACGPEVSSGGFLYIGTLGDDEFQRPNLGAVVIRKLLQDTVLKGRWTVAVVIPSDTELRCFLQAGFVQAKELALQGHGVVLFAVPSFLDHEMKSLREARSVPILEPMDGEPPSGINKDLLELVKNEGTEAQIRDLLAKGASIEASHAIHCCVYNGDLERLEILLRLTPSPKEGVNQPDGSGLVPLMLAAKGACGVLSRFNRSVPTACCARLIAAGAEVCAVDAEGCTALGHLWRKLRDLQDFEGCFGLEMGEYDSSDLEKLLMPPSGPTTADEQLIDAASDEENVLDWEGGEEEDLEDDDEDLD